MRKPIRLAVDPAAGAILKVSSLDEWGMEHWDTHAPSCAISISFPLEYKRVFWLDFYSDSSGNIHLKGGGQNRHRLRKGSIHKLEAPRVHRVSFTIVLLWGNQISPYIDKTVFYFCFCFFFHVWLMHLLELQGEGCECYPKLLTCVRLREAQSFMHHCI